LKTVDSVLPFYSCRNEQYTYDSSNKTQVHTVSSKRIQMVKCHHCGYFPEEEEENEEGDRKLGYDPKKENEPLTPHQIETAGTLELLVCGACDRVIASS